MLDGTVAQGQFDAKLCERRSHQEATDNRSESLDVADKIPAEQKQIEKRKKW